MRRPLDALARRALSPALGLLLACGAAAPPSEVLVTRGATARPAPRDAEDARRPQEDAERVPTAGAPALGSPSALLTVVAFVDYQCPFCLRAEPTLRALRQQYGAELRVVYRMFPLAFHHEAPLAAEAALAAHAQGRFEAFHNLLVDNARALERADLERYAQQAGLDLARFRSDLEQGTHREAVAFDHALGERLGVSGTPYFLVDGTPLSGARPREDFVALFDRVLVRARNVVPRYRAYATLVADPVRAPARRGTRTLDPSTVYRVPADNAPARGAAQPLVTVVLFSDFQCPFCARVEPTLQALLQRYDDVRVVLRNMPLGSHARAPLAAEATLEVLAQRGLDAYWRYYQLVLQNRSELEDADLARMAATVGADPQRVLAALRDRRHRQAVETDRELGSLLRVDGTPTCFINGRRLAGAASLERFAAMVDAARAEAQRRMAQGTPRAGLYEALTGNGARAPVFLEEEPEPAPPPAEARVYSLAPAPGNPYLGEPQAAVTLDHFADFQCPYCAQMAPALAEVLRAYGPLVRVVWRDYPLGIHDEALEAAEAAREVFVQQGNPGFWRYRDALFQNQRALTRADLERYAQAQGVDLARFRAALDSHAHRDALRTDTRAADATGAELGTPMTFINGRLLLGAVPLPRLRAVIDEQLRARGLAIPGGAPAPAAPVTAHARQILVTWRGAEGAPSSVTRTRAQARMRIEQALGELHAGRPFAAVAARYSDDPGAAQQGGDLGVITPGQTLPAFEHQLFALQPGGTSAVFETPLGFHLLLREP